jgi:hypothetical protein
METIVDDMKREGMWVKNLTLNGVHVRTRSYYAWKSLNNRCRTYGSINKFEDFQHFAEFMQTLEFKMQRETNGKLWQCDKDFNLLGDRSYCENNLIILPNEMNSFITSMDKERELPLGVIYIDRTCGGEFKGLTKPYRANCKDRVMYGSTKYLQYFETPIEAHLAWVKEKKSLLLAKMTKQNLVNHERFKRFSEYWLSEFDECITLQKEFKRNEVQS